MCLSALASPSPMILLPVSGKELQRDTERAVTIIFLYIWGERERGPLLWTRRTRCHDILYIYIRPAPATAHARRYAQTYVSSRLNLRSRSPQNAQHFTSYWGERERGPLLWTQRTRCHDRRYIYIYGRHPLLRMRGATRKRSRPDRESIQSS